MTSNHDGFVDEARGREILGRRFRAAGLGLVTDHPMTLAGKVVRLDGFDPVRRIGFEYVTTEAGDREELSPEVLEDLEARSARGELCVLLIDEKHVPSEAALERAADRFLGVALRRMAPPPFEERR
ncbi:MAG: hypothetical protein FJ096_04970 [Deltaproteobacteria bacterium]|nr:hypothetical protein [Deltaproteobacteria bacterium]